MNLFKPILRIGSRFQEIEFAALLSWGLLFPAKESYLYFFGFAALLSLFSLKKIHSLKNLPLMRMSVPVLLFNLLLIGAAFFSRHPGRSLLFICDILLLSIWFSLFDVEEGDIGRYLRLTACVISVASLAAVVVFIARAGRGPLGVVFKNPILQGIAAALAALIFLQALLKRFNRADAALLAVNAGAVIVSASKAAFLGLALFAAVLILARKRKWIVVFLAVLIALALVPNPLRRMAVHSLRHDPYVYDRLDIWSMSARMLCAHPWTGVGPDLFGEAARQFNFPQDKGPARYSKVPESPHSDYWKVVAETGLPGLLFVLLFTIVVVRRLAAPPRLDGAKVALAFLLLQMLLFNFIFNSFFLLLFFFLLYAVFWRRLLFFSPTPLFKLCLTGLLLLVFSMFYLMPWIADRALGQAAAEKNIISRYARLRLAAFCSPLDDRVPLARARVLRAYFKASANLEAWQEARESLTLAQKLNRNSSDAHLLESSLLADMAERQIAYPGLLEETLAPLRRAEALEPFNPFLKLRQARVLSQFNRRREALLRAREALALEPDFVAALFFVRQMGDFQGTADDFRDQIARIRAKAEKWRAKPGSYLFELQRMPE
jgi:O-antigen ligase